MLKLKYNNQLSLFLKKTVKEDETRSFVVNSKPRERATRPRLIKN